VGRLLMGWSALTGGLAMVMSATPSAPTSMVTRIDPAAMGTHGPWDASCSAAGSPRERKGTRESGREGEKTEGGLVGKGKRKLPRHNHSDCGVGSHGGCARGRYIRPLGEPDPGAVGRLVWV